jgi:hypothetical protein
MSEESARIALRACTPPLRTGSGLHAPGRGRELCANGQKWGKTAMILAGRCQFRSSGTREHVQTRRGRHYSPDESRPGRVSALHSASFEDMTGGPRSGGGLALLRVFTPGARQRFPSDSFASIYHYRFALSVAWAAACTRGTGQRIPSLAVLHPPCQTHCVREVHCITKSRRAHQMVPQVLLFAAGAHAHALERLAGRTFGTRGRVVGILAFLSP